MPINVIYDDSTTPVAGLQAAFNYVVNLFNNLFLSPVEIDVTVKWVGLDPTAIAQNLPEYMDFNYSDVQAHLPSLPADFPANGHDFHLTIAEANMLGLDTSTLAGSNTTATSEIDFNSGVNFDFNYHTNGTPAGNAAYFIGVAEHELSETMGRVAWVDTVAPDNIPNLDFSGVYGIMDVFRYYGPNRRALDTNNPNPNNQPGPYFSLDNGATNLGTFNNDPAADFFGFVTKDLGDWTSAGPGLDSDSFGPGGNGHAQPLTTTDLALMRAIGWSTLFPANVVPSGVVDDVLSGQTHNEIQVLAGGYQEVGNGGSATNTLVAAGGLMQVDSGGSATSAFVANTGSATINGTAVNTFVIGGGFVSVGGSTGGSTSGTFLEGGLGREAQQDITSNGFAISTTVESGGLQTVEAGGTISSALVLSGGDEQVASGGRAFSSILSGGIQSVEGTARRTEVDAGGQEFVSESGVASNTTVNSGGAQSLLTGQAQTFNTTVNSGGAQDIGQGTANFTTVNNGGLQTVEGLAVSALLSPGGSQTVDGGTASGTIISGGTENVTKDPFGIGGTTINTIINAGTENVNLDCVDSGTVVNAGGTLALFGGARDFGRTINPGGTLLIGSGYVLNDGSTFQGNFLNVAASGTTININVGGGAQETVLAGGTASGSVVYGFLGGPGGVVSGTEVVQGTASGTHIDFFGVESVGGTDFDAKVTNGGTQYVNSGGKTFNTQVSSGGRQIVLSGGKADPTTIYSGGMEIVSAGGADIGALISGGEQDVYGSATGVVVMAGSQVVESGGTAIGTVVSGGGTLVVLSGGTASGTIVADGGLETVNSGGTVSGATVSGGGILYVSSGGAADGVTSSDGGIFATATQYPNFIQLPASSTGDLGRVATDAPTLIDAALTHGITFRVGNGSDAIVAGPNDNVRAGDGTDIITGAANDTITAGGGNDTINSGDNSKITAGNGNDTVTAGANSTITVGNGNDTVTAGPNSTITVGNGNDTVTAGANSTITVGNGNDTIHAGANDLINLGTGFDTVSFGESPTAIGNETINHFNPTQDFLQFNPALLGNYIAAFADTKQVGANTVIQIDATDSMALTNVTATALSANNFHFSKWMHDG
jgi:autotransporter passenger strand-loop-strand repeat protein